MDAGHQVQTMDESDALRLCGDWLYGLRGGSEARHAFVGPGKPGDEGTLKDTATLTHAHGHFDIDGPSFRLSDIDGPSFRLSEAPQAGLVGSFPFTCF
jgi:hypothetical protein